MLQFQRGTKGRYNNHISRRQVIPVHQHLTLGVHNELHTHCLQVCIDTGIMDHLAEQEYALAGVLLYCTESDLDSIFYTITKAKMPGKDHLQRTQLQNRRSKISFHFIISLSLLLYSIDQRAAIMCIIGDI